MSFFEELPDPPPRQRHQQPPWMAPPAGELPVPVALELVAGRSADAAVLVGPLRVYSTGFELELTVLVREWQEPFFDPLHLHPHSRKENVLRLGVAYADGSSVEIHRHPERPGQPGRALTSRGGGGGEGRWDLRLWAWPLPPPGEIDAVCFWPRFDIPETRASFGAQPVLEAAARVERLWPGSDAGGSGGSTWVRMHHVQGDG